MWTSKKLLDVNLKEVYDQLCIATGEKYEQKKNTKS